MKSLLQEASSVERAVAQAWEAAGRPQEFSIKVLEKGERGFLGFSSKPAVVSLTYVMPHTKQRSHDAHQGKKADQSARPERSRSERPERQERSERSERHERSDRPEKSERRDRNDRHEAAPRRGGLLSFDENGNETVSERAERPERRERNDRREKNDRRREKPADRPARGLLSFNEGEEEQRGSQFASPRTTETGAEDTEFDAQDTGWDNELVAQVRANLQEMLDLFGHVVSFETNIEDRTLNVIFDHNFIGDAEAERLFYASASFLLLQFLKKSHKRRFRGFRIMFAVK